MTVRAARAWRRRIHPKLRMVLNGSAPVNACRAETAGFMRVAPELARRAPALRSALPARAVSAERVAVRDLDASGQDAVEVNLFVYTSGVARLPGERSRQSDLAVLRLPLARIPDLAREPGVAFVEHAEALKAPKPLRLAAGDATPAARSARIEGTELHRHGEGVLIGIVDVEGFDWTHPDFADGAGGTRFVAIWDQGGKNCQRPPPQGFDYGEEITAERMRAALAEAPRAGVSPHGLEPQSEMLEGSHGTHVAGIAAGNTGVCSRAEIAAVLVSLPPPDEDARRTSFYDSTRLLDAVRYLLELAERRGRPISINVSLGTNGHAHDGSSALDRWLDAWLAKPGRSICVAAGNAGQERPEAPGDLSYMLGRIHTSGRVASRGLDHDVEWVVAGDTVVDVSENELEIWYEPQDRFAVSVLPPLGGGDWIGQIRPGEFLENIQLPDRTMLSVYNECYHPTNGQNCISIYLSPYMGNPVVGVTAGTWLVRLHGLEVRDGRFHGWIERDDPVELGEGRHFWPSFFSPRSNVDASSVSSLACGARVVSVANLDEINRRVNASSSQGPTRDGRLKPDVAAPGTGILAANGFGRSDQPWIAMTGTSMASPYVAGVVGLMLAAEPMLGAAQINGILRATARPLPGKGYEWVNDCGFGVVAPSACVREAAMALDRIDAKGQFE